MDAHFESGVVLFADEELDAVAGGKPSRGPPGTCRPSVVKLLDIASVNLCKQATFGTSG